MSPRTTALLLLTTAVLGRGVLSWRGGDASTAAPARLPVADSGALAEHRRGVAARSAEVGAGEVIDVDQAGAGELARLPGVGAGLARRIVAERTRGGAFGGVACLDRRVPGIGPKLLERAGPHLVFGTGGCEEGGGVVGSRGGCPEVVDLNRAGRAELECLPGVGKARAESILALRGRRGGSLSVEALREVPGLPERVLEGLSGRVRAGPVP
jgi:competence protein ComEA